ncbi:hypothetical protein R6Q57_027663 [Mikania cordata]
MSSRFDMHQLLSELSEEDFRSFCNRYHIAAEFSPTLPRYDENIQENGKLNHMLTTQNLF